MGAGEPRGILKLDRPVRRALTACESPTKASRYLLRKNWGFFGSFGFGGLGALHIICSLVGVQPPTHLGQQLDLACVPLVLQLGLANLAAAGRILGFEGLKQRL
jgi:hypothetical protein